MEAGPAGMAIVIQEEQDHFDRHKVARLHLNIPWQSFKIKP
jgi:hypothetical protein